MEKSFIDLSQCEIKLDMSDSKVIDKLLNGLANKLNNTMATILGNVNLVEVLTKSGESSSEILKSLRKIINNIEPMSYISQRLMILSKKYTLSKKKFSLKISFPKIIKQVFQYSQQKITVHFNEDVDNILGDEFLISEMLYNLLENAKQATYDKGEVSVNVSKVNIAEKTKYLGIGEYIRIDIQDTGQGISEDLKKTIWKPFVSSSENFSGLGLPIVAQIIKKHDGAVSMQSEKGEGTSLSVFLPYVHKDVKNITSAYFKNKNILFVDDNDALREVACKMFDIIGFTCDATGDTKEAIDLLHKKQYSLIVLDLFLNNNEKGNVFLREVKSIAPEIKSLLSSGYSNHEVLVNYKSYGFDGILKKPFSLDVLKNALENLSDLPK